MTSDVLGFGQTTDQITFGLISMFLMKKKEIHDKMKSAYQVSYRRVLITKQQPVVS